MDGGQRRAVTTGSLVFTGLLWLLTGYLAFGALSFPFEARLAPLLFGGLAFVFLTHLLVRNSLRFLGTFSVGGDIEEGGPGEGAPPPDYQTEPAYDGPAIDEAIALAWIIGSAILVLVLGFVIGMTIAVFALVRIYAKERTRTAVALTVGVMGALYFVFGQLLNTPLFPGLLGLFG